MNREYILASIGLTLCLVLAACSLPGLSKEEPGPGPDGSDLPTETLELALTPSFTPSATETSAPLNPLISVSMDTNCRKGPGQVYDYLGGLMVGETAEVIARDPSGHFWYIRNPDAPGFCWVWGEYAMVSGDVNTLPVYTPEPTPTTPIQGEFSIIYLDTAQCGPKYAVKFRVSNTGNLTWESIRLAVIDLTLNVSNVMTQDVFSSGTGCVFSNHPDLSPGEIIETGVGGFSNNPTGHSLSAFIKLCSQNGLAGTCLEKTIFLTP